MVQDLYKQKRSLELKWQLEYEQEGKYTLDMVRIDNAIKEIVAREFEEQTLQTKVDAAKAEVSIAT